MSNLIDLGAVRKAAEDLRKVFVDGLVETSITEADRAFRTTGSLAQSDPDLAQGINRLVLRRLTARVRKGLGTDPAAKAVRRTVLEQVRRIYTGRLLFLAEDKLAQHAPVCERGGGAA